MIPPLTKWINDIKTKLGFSRTMTAAGADVVDAVNKHSDQIGELDGYLQVKSLGCASLDNLKSNLLSVANSLPYNRATFITFWNSGVTDVLTYSGNYAGTLYNNYKTDTELIFTAVVSGKDGSVVSIGYNNGTWTFENLTNQIVALGPINNIGSDSTTAALSAAMGKLLGQRVIHGTIGNLGTLYLNKDYTTIYIYRFFNNYNKAGIYAHDFSNTVGIVYSTFDASAFTMSYNETTGWTIKNNIDGVLSYVAIQ